MLKAGRSITQYVEFALDSKVPPFITLSKSSLKKRIENNVLACSCCGCLMLWLFVAVVVV